jgi:hypothetical protein
MLQNCFVLTALCHPLPQQLLHVPAALRACTAVSYAGAPAITCAVIDGVYYGGSADLCNLS